MKCSHCWFNEKWKKEFLSEKLLSFEEIKKISESVKKLLFLTITGGEAFMREDIEEIIKLFTLKKKVYRYEIPTSGYDTDIVISKTENILKANPGIPFRVDVSLDGTEIVHDNIRGVKDAFKNAKETILALNKISKRFSYFDTGVITTISSFNKGDIESLAELISEIHPTGEWMVNIVRGEPRNSDAGKYDIESYNKAQKIIDMRIKEGTYNGHKGHSTAKLLTAKNAARRKLIVKILNNEVSGGGCSAGTLGAVVYPDGSLYPCELLKKSIGNIREYDYSIPKAWKSHKAKDIRNYIQDSKCICTQECFLSVNFLIQPGMWYSLLAERIKLIK